MSSQSTNRKISWIGAISASVFWFLLVVCVFLASIAIEFAHNGRVVPFVLSFIPLCGFAIATGYAAARSTG